MHISNYRNLEFYFYNRFKMQIILRLVSGGVPNSISLKKMNRNLYKILQLLIFLIGITIFIIS